MDEKIVAPSVPSAGKQVLYIDQANGPSVRKDNGDIETFKSIFGGSFGAVNLSTTITNTGIAFSQYLSLQKLGLVSGTYIIFWKCRFKMNTAGRNIILKLTNNSADIPRSLSEKELKDSGNDIREEMADFSIVNLSGDADIAIEFAPEQAGDTATMYSAEIFIFRAA